MIVDTNIKWDWWQLTISIADQIGLLHYDKPDISAITIELTRLLHLSDLHVQGIAAGWTSFDWDKGHELGWFCFNDYMTIPALEKFKVQAIEEWAGRKAKPEPS